MGGTLAQCQGMCFTDRRSPTASHWVPEEFLQFPQLGEGLGRPFKRNPAGKAAVCNSFPGGCPCHTFGAIVFSHWLTLWNWEVMCWVWMDIIYLLTGNRICNGITLAQINTSTWHHRLPPIRAFCGEEKARWKMWICKWGEEKGGGRGEHVMGGGGGFGLECGNKNREHACSPTRQDVWMHKLKWGGGKDE